MDHPISGGPPLKYFSLFRTEELTDKQVRLSLWGVSWMSFFWGVGTLMVVSIYPIVLTEVLGASYTEAGIIEGTAIFLSFVFKSFSGVLSDIFRRRKPMIGLGSLLSVLVKLIFATAHNVLLFSVARTVDRAVKGIRSSPTEALVADLSKRNTNRGESFGLYKTLSMLGQVSGSVVAMLLMHYTATNHQFIFYYSMIPGIIALLLLVTIVRQPPIRDEIKKSHKGWRVDDVKYLPKAFWILLFIAAVFMLSRFSESNIIYRARTVGWDAQYTPTINITMELVSACLVYPIGRLADRSNRLMLLMMGVFVLFLGNLIFISTASIVGVALGTITAGASLGMTHGLLSALIADSTPAELRGTAFAIYYFVVGTAVSFGNVIAGHLNDIIGTTGCFTGGLVFTSLTMLLLWGVVLRNPDRKKIMSGQAD